MSYCNACGKPNDRKRGILCSNCKKPVGYVRKALRGKKMAPRALKQASNEIQGRANAYINQKEVRQ